MMMLHYYKNVKDDIDYICLCSTNKEADTINMTELEKLIQDGKEFLHVKQELKIN